MSSPRKKKETFEDEEPYDKRIEKMDTSERIKNKGREKLKTIKGSSENAPKAEKYLDGLLKIPFNKIKSETDLDDPGKKLYSHFITKFPHYDIKQYGELMNYLKIIVILKKPVSFV